MSEVSRNSEDYHIRRSTIPWTCDLEEYRPFGLIMTSLCTGWFTSLKTMRDKYAQEMALIPKPSEGQSGGQVTPDTMDQFWQRRLLVDQLTTAPHVDRMMKLLNDMKRWKVKPYPQQYQARDRIAVITFDYKAS